MFTLFVSVVGNCIAYFGKMGKTTKRLREIKSELSLLAGVLKKKKKIKLKLEKLGVSVEKLFSLAGASKETEKVKVEENEKKLKTKKSKKSEKKDKSPVKEVEIEGEREAKTPIAPTATTEISQNDGSEKRFKRVEEKHVIENEYLQDNSYNKTFGQEGWGFKANEKLKHTRGKGFRHEKTKKKRGSYRGGAIDTNQVNSVKFD